MGRGIFAALIMLFAIAMAFAGTTTLLYPPDDFRFSNNSAEFQFRYDSESSPSAICVFHAANEVRTISVAGGKAQKTEVFGLPSGVHSWGVNCSESSSGAVSTSGERQFSVYTDTQVARNVSILSPSAGSVFFTSGISAVYVYGSGVLGPSEAECYLYLDGNLYSSNSDLDRHARDVALEGLAPGNHEVQVKCRPEGTDDFLHSQITRFKVGQKRTYSYDVQIHSPSPYFMAKKPADVIFSYTYFAGNASQQAFCTLMMDGRVRQAFLVSSGETQSVPLARFASRFSQIPFGTHTYSVSCRPTSDSGAPISSAERKFILSDPSPQTPKLILVEPDDGDTMRGTGANFSFVYYPGTAPSDSACSLMLDEKAKYVFTASAGNASTVSMQVGDVPPGRHTWQVRCENPDPRFPLYSEQRRINLVSEGEEIPARITLEYPSNWGEFNSPPQFSFRYASNDGPLSAKCTLDVDDFPESELDAVDGGQYTFRAPAGQPDGTHYWSVFCTSPSGQILGESEERTYLLGKTGASGLPAGSEAAMIADGAVQQTARAKAMLAVQVEAFLQEPVQLLLKSETGTPIPGADIFVRVPGTNMSVKLRTDESGKAAYVPTALGLYTYKAADFGIIGAPSTAVLKKTDGTQQKAMRLDEIVGIIFSYAAFAMVAVAGISAYMLLTKKKDEDD